MKSSQFSAIEATLLVIAAHTGPPGGVSTFLYSLGAIIFAVRAVFAGWRNE